MRAGLVVVIAIMAMASTGAAQTSPNFRAMASMAIIQAVSNTRVSCIAPATHWDSSSLMASAVGGKCRQGSKNLPIRFFHQYSLSDQAGNTCINTAAKKIAGKSFTLKGLPYRFKARFGVVPKDTIALVKWGVWKLFVPGGNDYQCGRVAANNMPPASALCAWDDSGLADPYGPTGSCGVPIGGACAWAGSASLNDHEVIAGPVMCTAGPCVYNTPATLPTVTWFTPTPIKYSVSLDCPGGIGAAVGLKDIRLAHYDASGQLVTDCEARPNGLTVTRFTIPESWTSGVLLADFRLYPYANKKSPPVFESQSNLFKLGDGLPTGCPLHLASVNSGP